MYKSAAPKFIAAATIKMHQAKAYNSKQSGSATASASIRNLHDKRQVNYSNTANCGTGIANFKRVLGNNRTIYNRAKHVLHSSSSETSSENEEDEKSNGAASERDREEVKKEEANAFDGEAVEDEDDNV